MEKKLPPMKSAWMYGNQKGKKSKISLLSTKDVFKDIASFAACPT